jgi:hypothetical protein
MCQVLAYFGTNEELYCVSTHSRLGELLAYLKISFNLVTSKSISLHQIQQYARLILQIDNCLKTMPSIAYFLHNEQGGEDSTRNEQEQEDLTHHGPHKYLAIVPMPFLHIVRQVQVQVHLTFH